jgi:hypothetical protein
MNFQIMDAIGTHGYEFGDHVDDVEIMDMNLEIVDEFGHRGYD